MSVSSPPSSRVSILAFFSATLSSTITISTMFLLYLSHLELSAADLLQFPLIPHHKMVEERRRKLLEGSTGSNIAKQQIDSLYQGYGTHYIDLWVGTPPQRQTVIVGTGSPKTGFPCSKCYYCGELYHTDAYFEEELSSTYRKFSDCNCTYGECSEETQECYLSTSYAEGSGWFGVESIDTTYAGGPHSRLQPLPGSFSDKDQDDADPLRAKNFAFDHTFACIDATTGLFQTQMADGIMGMDNSPESFWRQAYDHKVIDKKAYALCLSRQSTASKEGTEAGALTMGGYDARLHTSPMVYSNLDPTSTFVMTLKKIYLRAGGGGDSVLASNPNLNVKALNVGDVIYEQYKRVTIDSGTTDTYFPLGFSSAFKQLWEELAGVSYHHERMFLTEEKLNNLPTILIQFEGNIDLNSLLNSDPSNVPGLAGNLDPNNPYDIIVAIPPSHYMNGNTNIGYVARFYVDEMGYTATIGANTMMGHDVLFDVEEGALGFAESHCDYTKLEKDVAEEEGGTTGDEVVEENEEDNTIVETTHEKKPEKKPYTYVPADDNQNQKLEGTTNSALPQEKNGIENFDNNDGDKTSSWSGTAFTALTLLLFSGMGYIAYDRFGVRESLARRHGRVSTVDEDAGDLQLELQYVRPIV